MPHNRLLQINRKSMNCLDRSTGCLHRLVIFSKNGIDMYTSLLVVPARQISKGRLHYFVFTGYSCAIMRVRASIYRSSTSPSPISLSSSVCLSLLVELLEMCFMFLSFCCAGLATHWVPATKRGELLQALRQVRDDGIADMLFYLPSSC